jgi:hypothetical protein
MKNLNMIIGLICLTLQQIAPLNAQSIRGKEIPYSIDLPKGWTPFSPTPAPYDKLFTAQDKAIVGIIAETMEIPREIFLERVQKSFEKNLDNIEWKTSDWIVIDHGNWIKLQTTGQTQGKALHYLIYLYTGPEGSFQIIGWTETKDLPIYQPEIEFIAQSFKFEPSKQLH